MSDFKQCTMPSLTGPQRYKNGQTSNGRLRKALTAWNTNTFTNFSDLLRIFPTFYEFFRPFTNFSDLLRIFPTYLAFPDIPNSLQRLKHVTRILSSKTTSMPISL